MLWESKLWSGLESDSCWAPMEYVRKIFRSFSSRQYSRPVGALGPRKDHRQRQPPRRDAASQHCHHMCYIKARHHTALCQPFPSMCVALIIGSSFFLSGGWARPFVYTCAFARRSSNSINLSVIVPIFQRYTQYSLNLVLRFSRVLSGINSAF